MGKTSEKRRCPAMEENLTAKHPPSPTFRTLISAIEASEGLNLPFLKRLYSLLGPLSFKEPVPSFNFEGSFRNCGVELKSENIETLIHVFFKELDRRFELLFSALRDVPASRGQKHIESDTDVLATADELPLLLRCCIRVLNLADADTLVESLQFLLSVLRKLISLITSGENAKRSASSPKIVSSRSTDGDADGSITAVSEGFFASLCFTEILDPWCPALCAVLEIFADELIMGQLLRDYFILVDSTSTTDMLFPCHFDKGNNGIVMELISVHFISSVYGKQAYENFLKRLFCEFGKNYRVPELSLSAAVSLLLDPIMRSAPKILQTHLNLLVSEAIDVDISLKNFRPDLRLMTLYLTTFEASVHLYSSHMSSSLMDSHHLGVKCSFDTPRRCQPFESYTQQVTRDKISHLIAKSDPLLDVYICNMSCRTKADLLTAARAYINESKHIFDESCKNDLLSVISSIILGSFCCDVGDSMLYRKGDTSPQDIYLLASILKLMSTSLLNAIWCLRHDRNLGSPKTLKDASSKESDFLVGVIDCFRLFNHSLPNQKILFDMMNTCPMIHKTCKWMLLHFSGLLSLCFASGIDFLVKGCISTIMALLNLYLIEEGDIVSLSSLLVSSSQSSSSGVSSDEFTQAAVTKKSIRGVASKFQKIQTVYLRNGSCTSQRLRSEEAESSEDACLGSCITESSDGIEQKEETCNGEIFLKCLLGSAQKSDIDDLADFIECKPDVDYSMWLKDRERYRWVKWKRGANHRLEKKKKAWRLRRKVMVVGKCS